MTEAQERDLHWTPWRESDGGREWERRAWLVKVTLHEMWAEHRPRVDRRKYYVNLRGTLRAGETRFFQMETGPLAGGLERAKEVADAMLEFAVEQLKAREGG